MHAQGVGADAALLVRCGHLFDLSSSGVVYQYALGSGTAWYEVGTQDSSLAVDSSGNLFAWNPLMGTAYEHYLGSGGSWVQNAAGMGVLATVQPVAGAAYSPASGLLYNPNTSVPSYQDVQQTQLGDCWLMASLAEVAARASTDIETMFTSEGTTVDHGSLVSVYKVRYFNSSGTAEYIVVDTELPDGGNLYDVPTNGALWAALAEKAYAEANGAGFVSSNNKGSDSYAALGGGGASYALPAITGHATGTVSIDATDLATAWQNGDLIAMATPALASNATSLSSINSVNIVSNHVYAVVDYNSSTQQFTLFNPWGVNGSYEQMPNNTYVFCGGTVVATASQLAGVFTSATSDTGAAPAVGAFLALPQSPATTAPLAFAPAPGTHAAQPDAGLPKLPATTAQGSFAPAPGTQAAQPDSVSAATGKRLHQPLSVVSEGLDDVAARDLLFSTNLTSWWGI